MRRGRIAIGFTVFACLLMLAAGESRAQSVLFSAADLGGGLFRYDLAVDNTGGLEPICGLTIVNGNSVFGLDATGLIGAPPDWDFLAPDPPFVDALDYFSLDPAADVPVDGILSGFFFQSARNPATLAGGDFAVELFGCDTQSVVFSGPAQLVPEPGALALFGPGLLGLLGYARRRRT